MKQKMKLLTGAKGLMGLASVALLVPVVAIEKPAEADAPKQKDAKAAVADEAPKAAEKPAQKFAMLGVGGMSASETLSMHLGLEQGTGLTLYHIVPDSAAEKAGLKQHDILTEFGGKKIGSQQDLRDAIADKKPGEEVLVKFISRGKAQEKKIILGERKEVPGMVPHPGINPEWLQKRLGGNVPPIDVPPMGEEMMKRLQKMQKQLQQGGGMQLDLNKLLKDMPKGKAGKGGLMQFGAATSVTLMDNDGSITMKTADGKKEVVVKDKAGKVLFEGPYQTDQDKAAVPEEIRERIERLNIDDMQNGMKLQIGPMGIAPPLDEPEEEPAE